MGERGLGLYLTILSQIILLRTFHKALHVSLGFFAFGTWVPECIFFLLFFFESLNIANLNPPNTVFHVSSVTWDHFSLESATAFFLAIARKKKPSSNSSTTATSQPLLSSQPTRGSWKSQSVSSCIASSKTQASDLRNSSPAENNRSGVLCVCVGGESVLLPFVWDSRLTFRHWSVLLICSHSPFPWT